MKSASDLLEIRIVPSAFKQRAKQIITTKLELDLTNNIQRLNKVASNLNLAESVSSNTSIQIPEVFKKFKKYVNDRNLIFSGQELRTLTFSLYYTDEFLNSIFDSQNEIEIALELIERKWSDFYLVGIIDCFLYKWNSDNGEVLKIISRFIKKHLDLTNSKIKLILALKKNWKFFDLKNGDIIFGTELAIKNLSLLQSASLLMLSDSMFKYSYFDRVIDAYLEKMKWKFPLFLDDFLLALETHNSFVLSKRIVSKLIHHANRPDYIQLQDQIKSAALKIVGDPANIGIWSSSSNDADSDQIKNARLVLLEWITRQFINVFFEIINDNRRKYFWLKHLKHIRNFKVFGPVSTYNQLKRDERISEFLDSRFSKVLSNRDASAFIFYFDNHMVIEFSVTGFACCIYRNDSWRKPDISRQLNSVEDLRNSSLPVATRTDSADKYIFSEGRLMHSQNWEEKFDLWLTKNVFNEN